MTVHRLPMSLVADTQTARDLTLDAAREVTVNRKTTRHVPPAQIKRMLDSRIEREVIDGLRKIIAMQYTSPLSTTLPFFPAVLKTLSNPTPLTRSLVYAYLTHHAEADADTALLSINTIQKSFSDSNPRVRALALRTMSALRVPVISQIVSLAIKRALTDASPVVRKTAAFACVKCVRLDPKMLPQVTEYLDQLLGDQQYHVVGAAVAVFSELCPDRIDLLHRHYRSIVKQMVDMDEWGQLATLRVLTAYARACFPYRTKRVPKVGKTVTAAAGNKTLISTDDFYADESTTPATEQATDDLGTGEHETRQVLDPDLTLLLDTAEPLLQSRNSAVIVAVTKAYLYLAPDSHLPQAISSLVALLRSPLHIRQTSLHDIVQVCLAHPALLVPYFRHFLLSATETASIACLKLELMTLIFPHSKSDVQGLILAELDHSSRTFARSHDQDMVRQAVGAIGRCAQASTGPTLAQCTRLLLAQLQSSTPDQEHSRILVTEALEVVRHLIQRDPEAHHSTVIRLAKSLDALVAPTARASVVWLVGEFASLASTTAPEASIAPDVLRILLKGYINETDLVREQIILLAAKLYLHWLNAESSLDQSQREAVASPPRSASPSPSLSPSDHRSSSPIELLYNHALLLARYTPSYDLRDRARLIRALLPADRCSSSSSSFSNNMRSNSSNTDLATLVLLAPKPVPSNPSRAEQTKHLQLGTSTLAVHPAGRADSSSAAGLLLKGYADLPEWVSEGREPDPALRDVLDDSSKAAGHTGDARRGDGNANANGGGSAAASNKLDQAVALQQQHTAGLGKSKTLDRWLDEGSTSEGSEGSEGSEQESSGSEEEDSDDDDDEDEDDDSDDDDDDDDDDGEEEDSDDDDDETNGNNEPPAPSTSFTGQHGIRNHE